jgi:putative ABC transport system permease protein
MARRARLRSSPPRVRLLARDLVGQSLLEALGRPGRTLLTVLGTVLGVGMFVATLGVTETARSRVNQDFDVLVSTEVDVQDARPDDGLYALTAVAERRARTLNGVTGAGLLGRVDGDVRIARWGSTADAQESGVGLSYVDAGALAIVRPHILRGRAFAATAIRRNARVALLGRGAARALGVAPTDLPTALDVDARRFVVAGIVDRVDRHDELLADVVIPSTTAKALLGPRTLDGGQLMVTTRFGYASSVGGALAPTVSPVDPDRVAVVTPPDPNGLRGEVTNDLSGLLAVMGGVGLLVGMIGIGNTTLLSVLERVREIGLRRAIGARRGQIAGQFLIESLVLGTIGGMLGACLGVIAITGVALSRGWIPTLQPWLPLAAPLLGTVTGLLAGAYPAVRAARVDPVTALTH